MKYLIIILVTLFTSACTHDIGTTGIVYSIKYAPHTTNSGIKTKYSVSVIDLDYTSITGYIIIHTNKQYHIGDTVKIY